MESRRKYGRNHDCKGSIHRYQTISYQGNSYYYKKLLWWDLHRVHGHEHKVQGRLPLLQCIPFHSLLAFDEVAVLKFFIWQNTRRVWLMKTFEFTHTMKGIGSTHRGIVETYTTSFNSKYHQLESRAWLAKSEYRIYQWYYVSGK